VHLIHFNNPTMISSHELDYKIIFGVEKSANGS
jgi:hypothetical protein